MIETLANQMMMTRVSSATRELVIGGSHPTVLIGERINPAGKKKLALSLQSGDLQLVREEALAQEMAGADMLDVNVGSASNVDEVDLLPRAVRAVMDVSSLPLVIDSDNPKALEAALKVYTGKPLINSVSGQKRRLREVLPLAKEYGAAVIGLTLDDDGIPQDADKRLAIAGEILERALAAGIPGEDVIIDCLALATASDLRAGMVTLDAICRVHTELGLNQTCGASNISFGLPDRHILNDAFLAVAISRGVTCPVVDVARARGAVLATDLLMNRDAHALRYINWHRDRQDGSAS